MKVAHFTAALVGALLIQVSTIHAAQIEPASLSYQGTLTDSAGQPLTGTQTIQICLYKSPTGASGLPLPDPANGSAFWCDNYTVALKNGNFSVVLGSDAKPLAGKLNDFNGTTYVGVKVGTDPEMTPRQKLTSVAYAFHATHAANADNATNAVNAQNAQNAAVANAVVATNYASIIPPGMVSAYAGETAPSGWLLCDGRSLLKADYQPLWNAIGNAHGSVDSNHFNLPDYRGRFLRGVDERTSGNLDTGKANRTAMNPGGNTGTTPSSVGSIESDEAGPHTHPISIYGNFVDYNYWGWGVTLAQTGGAARNTGTAIENSGKETRPKNAFVNWIIKY